MRGLPGGAELKMATQPPMHAPSESEYFMRLRARHIYYVNYVGDQTELKVHNVKYGEREIKAWSRRMTGRGAQPLA